MTSSHTASSVEPPIKSHKLVVVYSHGGTTRLIGRKIAAFICADLLEILESTPEKKPKKEKSGKKKASKSRSPTSATTTTTSSSTTLVPPPSTSVDVLPAVVMPGAEDSALERESSIGKLQFLKMCYRAKFKVTNVPVAERITPSGDPVDANKCTVNTHTTTSSSRVEEQSVIDALAENTASTGGWSHLETYTTIYIGAPVYANHLPAPCRSWLVAHRDKFLMHAAKKAFHFFTTTWTSGASDLFTDITDIMGVFPVSTLCVLSRNADTWTPKKMDFFTQDPGTPPTSLPSYMSEGRLEDHYEVLPTMLGRGTFSVVHKGVHKATGEFVAIKKLQKNSLRPETMRLLRREMIILRKLTHPNIVHLRDVFETDQCVYMVIELVSGGELWRRISATGSFSEEEAQCVLRQVLEAVDYMHSNGIIHRDLKPENLLCVDDTGLHIKITDFGLATDSVMEPSVVTPCGTPSYVAPEVFQGGEYDNKCDIWSAGVLLYVMLSGYMPFDADTLEETLRRITSGKLYFPDSLFGHVSPAAQDLVSYMLTVSPDDRPTAGDCLAHSWFSQSASSEPLYTELTFLDQQNSFYKYITEKESSMDRVD
ncbi:CAMK protein kinase [Pelomyxa schiedti]|nr:CAMK protein kinase [Pelomyxa schiedti]